MKPNRKNQLLLAAIPMAGFAFPANLIWDAITGDGTTVADGTGAGGIGWAGNFTLGSLSRVKSVATLGGSGATAVSGASRQEPISSNHNEHLLLR